MADATAPEEEEEDLETIFRELRTAGEELRTVVQQGLGDLQSSSLRVLDADGLLHALRTLPSKPRKQILGELGLHGGKGLNAGVAGLALRKLWASDPGFQQWAALRLAIPTWNALAEAGGAISEHWIADAAITSQATATLSDTPPSLLRLALASCWEHDDAHVAPAAILRLLEDDLILEEWQPNRAEIHRRCSEAAVQIDAFLREVDNLLEIDEEQDEAVIGDSEALDRAADDRSSNLVPAGEAQDNDNEWNSDLEESLRAVEQQHKKASTAAARILERVGAGSPADVADLAQLAAFAESFAALRDQVAVELPEAATGAGVSTLDDAKRALQAAADGVKAASDIEGLKLIAELPEHHPLLGFYKAARERAMELLRRAAVEWSDSERSDARQLAVIAATNASGVGERQPQPPAPEDFREEFRGALGLAIGRALPVRGDDAPAGQVASFVEPTAETDPVMPAPIDPTKSDVSDERGAAGEETAQPHVEPAPEPQELSHESVVTEKPAAAETASDGDGSSGTAPARVRLSKRGDAETAASLPDAATAGEPTEADSEGTALLCRLIRERRFGLAYWVATSLEYEPIIIQMLEIAAYADKMRAPAGECAGAFKQALENIDLDLTRASRGAQLLAIGAGVPAAVFSPYSGAADLLRHVAPAFRDHEPLSRLLAAVVVAAERGVQIEADFARRTRDLTSLEAELNGVLERAAEMRTPKTLVFARASDVWRHWVAPDGPLGTLLTAVELDDEARVADVERRVLELRAQRELERLIDQTDRALRRRTARAQIQARARQGLLKGAKDALDVVAEWVDLVREREARRRGQASVAWQQEPLDDLRTAANESRLAILEVAAEWQSAPEPEASAGTAAGAILDDLLLLLGEGQPLSGTEPLAYLVLGEELLKAPEVPLSPTLIPLEGPPTVESLAHAAGTDDWAAAYDARARAGDHDATKQIIALVAQTDPNLATQLETQRDQALQTEREHVSRLHEGALRELDAARRLGHITDEAWGRYYSQLESLEIDTTLRLGAAADALSRVLDALAEHRRDEVERANTAFKKLGIPDASIVGRVERLLDAGDIAAYQELVLAVQRGLTVPEPEYAPPYVEEFFPAVIDSLAKAVPHSDELLAAAEAGAAVGPLDFSGVGPERRADVVAAMTAWVELLARDRSNQHEKLRRIMWALGFDAEEIELEEPAKRQRRGGRSTTLRTGDLRARPIGRALVPAFGSGAEGKYRLLLTFERMTEEALLDRVAQEPGDAPIIVLNFGSMSVQVRRGLIDQVRRQRRRPVCVVDTAAFLFVCAKGGGLETLMRVTLPFTAVNPYTPFVAGKVPREMFYGRKHELESVIDANGTSFIYGGRRLGKSALLRAAEREFAATSAEHHAVYVDLKNHGIGEWRPASDVHEVLAREFADRNIITSHALKGSPDDLYEELGAWIEGGEDRRILLLLDEADEFLNADATEGFRIVRRLKELMDRTERRFKPVLAGLHQVQRFQSIPNQPLAHLGQPIAVGPLSPQYAFNLVVTPLHALGYRFASDEIVFRILTNTNYQPSLIQLFGDELVKHMLKRPVSGDAPPFVITMDDVESVYSAPDLANETRNRFEQTINLDPRYRVIAYVLALQGLDAQLSASVIREECEEWWPAGFEDTTEDEFRALLDELKGLGILYSEAGRYTMRSPNVLRMLGTHDQIEDRLLGASEVKPPQKFQAATFRAPMTDDPYKRSPLSEQQTAELTRPESEVRLVIGSTATDVESVAAGIAAAADRASTRVEALVVQPDGARLRRALSKQSPGRHRLVVCPFGSLGQQDAMELMKLAVELGAQPRESTCGVAFVAGAENLDLWRSVLGAGDSEPHVAGVNAVVLRRWSDAGLRAWSHGQDVDLPFVDDEAIERVRAVTGGWPSLVDMFVTRYLDDHRFDKALEVVNATIGSPAGARAFLDQTGLTNDQSLLSAWKQLVEYGEPVEREDLLALLESEDPPVTAVELLRALQAVEVSEEGRISPEPTLLRVWNEAGAPEAAA